MMFEFTKYLRNSVKFCTHCAYGSHIILCSYILICSLFFRHARHHALHSVYGILSTSHLLAHALRREENPTRRS